MKLIRKNNIQIQNLKKAISLVLLLMLSSPTYACPECEKQQPKVLQGIAHGAGPESNWDYVVVWTVVLIVLITFTFTLMRLIKPGEKETNHIKRTIINFE